MSRYWFRKASPVNAQDTSLAAGPVSDGGGGWMGVWADECVEKASHGLPAVRACATHSALRRLMKLVRYSRCGSLERSAEVGVVVVRGQT
jgi:hypothetical protein